MPRSDRPRIAFEETAAPEGRRTWAARAGEETVGLLTAWAGEEADTVRIDVSVAPEHRRRGIGREMVGRFLGLQAYPRATRVVAHVPEAGRDAAVALLAAAGFRPDAGPVHDAESWSRGLPSPGRRVGVGRFLSPEGRIARFPVASADLRELLAHAAERLLSPGEVLSEPEFNIRLAQFTDDVALLRRHLVDHGFVERTRSGSEYALSEPVDN